jgi:hypothetical protein
MKLERIPHNPGQLLEFYEEGLTQLGALCERTWHDRLEVIAEGRAAQLWQAGGAMHEIELQFAPAETACARDAARQVFPGCPLTFHLADALRLLPLPLERFVLPETASARLSWKNFGARNSPIPPAGSLPGRPSRTIILLCWRWPGAKFKPWTSTGHCIEWPCLWPMENPFLTSPVISAFIKPARTPPGKSPGRRPIRSAGANS